MEEQRKRIVVKFLISELNREVAYGDDLWLSHRVNEHYPSWRCAVEILKSEPPPSYEPRINQFFGVRAFTRKDTRETIATGVDGTGEVKTVGNRIPFLSCPLGRSQVLRIPATRA